MALLPRIRYSENLVLFYRRYSVDPLFSYSAPFSPRRTYLIAIPSRTPTPRASTAARALPRWVARSVTVITVDRTAPGPARTSLAVLRQIAGPVSCDTLTALLTASASGLDPMAAASEGLGA